MHLKTVRHVLEFAFFRAVQIAAGRLPRVWVKRLGRGLGRLAFRWGKRQRELAQNNMALTLPELSATERARTARACFEHFGSYFCEVLIAHRLTEADIRARFQMVGLELLASLQQERRGFFFTTGHFGVWELALYPLALQFAPLHIVVRPPNNPWIDRALTQIRGRFGVTIIDKRGAGHRMVNALRRGGRVGVVIDQHVRPNLGIQVPFLGVPAWASPMVAKLSLRTGVPVVPFACVPADDSTYCLRFRPPIYPEGEGDAAERELTCRYLAAVEDDIRRTPELWLWMHRRWRQ